MRYQSAAEMRADLQSLVADHSAQAESTESRGRSRWKWLAAGATVCIAMIAGGSYWHWHKPVRFVEGDTIVLADFDNQTGDAVFDDTLKQGLSVQLDQSPFLDLVSDRKVNQTLKEMGRYAGDHLTPEVSREVCQRMGSKAVVAGSIAGLGSQCVIGLKAVSCNTGDVLADVQERAAGKGAVLKALDKAAVSMRSKLGESLGSVEKYATPLDEATTPSLEALKAFSLGRNAKGDTASLPFYKRAAELDPNFAVAYQSISVVYGNRNEVEQSAENARRAYELREKVSERERVSIEASYYVHTTGELEKAVQACELWQQNYPRDVVSYGKLGFIYASLGRLKEFLEVMQEATRINPNRWRTYGNLAIAYQYLNRLDEADKAYGQGNAKKGELEGESFLAGHYLLAFLKGDTAQMAQLAAAAMGKPGTEDLLRASQADTEAWHGKLKNASKLTQLPMDSAQHNDAKETAAAYQAAAALREVESGHREEARADADSALKVAPNRDVRAMAALALARAGEYARAEKVAAELHKQFPLTRWCRGIAADYPSRGRIGTQRPQTGSGTLGSNRRDRARAADHSLRVSVPSLCAGRGLSHAA